VPTVPGVFLDSSMTVFDRLPQRYGEIVYDGGACALEVLAHMLGHTTFRAMLKTYVAEHRYGVTTKADFLAAVHDAAPPGFDVNAWARGVRLRGA
jgi:aminopeptidase N